MARTVDRVEVPTEGWERCNGSGSKFKLIRIYEGYLILILVFLKS